MRWQSRRQWLAVLAVIVGTCGCSSDEPPPTAAVSPVAHRTEPGPVVVTPVAELAPIVDRPTPPLNVAPTDSPWWRGPRGDGIADAACQPPLVWSATENIAWQVPLPGRGYGSPTVVGEHIYLATAEAGAVEESTGVVTPARQSIVCLDRSTGTHCWTAVIHEDQFPRAVPLDPLSSDACGTVACDGSQLYISFLFHKEIVTTALDLDGRQIWQSRVDFSPTGFSYGASPVITGSLVLVAADSTVGGTLTAYHRGSGRVRWQVKRPTLDNWSTPIVAAVNGQPQVLLAGCNLTAGYDPETGQMLWSVPGPADSCVAAMASDGQLVFASGGSSVERTLAVRPGDPPIVAWEVKHRSYVPSLLLYQGYLYSVDDSGVATCFDAQTGQQMWKARLGGNFSASPVLAAGHIFVTSHDGITIVFPANGQEYQPVSKNPLGAQVEVKATPSIAGRQIFIRAVHHAGDKPQEFLYCVGMPESQAAGSPSMPYSARSPSGTLR